MVYHILCFVIGLLLCSVGLPAQTISGIINSYAPVVEIDSSTCCTRVIVEKGLAVSPGDRVMIIQMKGAVAGVPNSPDFGKILDYNETGIYEFASVRSVAGGGTAIELGNRLSRSYDTRYAVQLIRVPRYTAPVIVSGRLTAQGWDGRTGGVLVFEAPGQSVTLQADIDVSERGFRGGSVSARPLMSCSGAYPDYTYPIANAGVSAFKGEGIASNNDYELAGHELGRGALANGGGGGNNHNSGGAGGAGGGAGGNGGATYTAPNGGFGCQLYRYGGIGGYVAASAVDRIFPGGGGGGGHDGDGAPSTSHKGTDGGAGGGIVIIKARNFTGNGHAILADGTGVTELAQRDGAGGGGAGGTIILHIASGSTAMNGLTISARGGIGGNTNSETTGGNHGPGGGGGGGVIRISNTTAPATTDVAGGASGTNTPSGLAHEATPGSPGIVQRIPFELPEAPPCSSGAPSIINSYTPVVAITISDCNAELTVEDPAAFAVGDKILIIQMQGAAISDDNDATYGTVRNMGKAGNFEFARIIRITGNTFLLAGPLEQLYSVDGRVQAVRVPEYRTAEVSSATCLPWNGSVGGVLVLSASDTVRLGCDIDVSGKGFRGGVSSAAPVYAGSHIADYRGTFDPSKYAAKGEGIAFYGAGLNTSGKGAPANAGGGGNNFGAGGGGGANAGCGGNGGWATPEVAGNYRESQGLGGHSIPPSAGRALMGGGGGAGHGTEPTQWDANGGNGGGIVIIETNVLDGRNGVIRAGGESANFTEMAGAGGGGAGGSIVLQVKRYSSPVYLDVRGGRGGNAAAVWGPGGGGSGGGVYLSSPALPGAVQISLEGGAGGNTGAEVWGSTNGCVGMAVYNFQVTGNTVSDPRVRLSPGDTTLCRGESVQLSATGGTLYQWSPVGGLSCTDCPDPVATPVQTTTFAVMVTDLWGCLHLRTVTLEVEPEVKAVAQKDTTICNGQTIRLTASGGTTYVWSPADGLSCTNCQSPFASPAATTTYTVVVSNGGKCTATSSATITVIEAGMPDLPDDALLCAGDSLVLDLPSDIAYQWSPAAGLSCTDCASVVIKPDKTTIYTVVMTNATGCRVVHKLTVTVADAPTVSVTPDFSLCSNAPPVRLTAKGGNYYHWSPSDGLSCTDCAQPLATPSTTTTYTVRISINSRCEATTTVTITVLPAPVLAISPDTTICAGAAVPLQASGGISYRWSPPDGLSCTDCAGPIAMPETTTTYTVVATDAAGCQTTGSVRVTVRGRQDFTISPDVEICAGSSTQLVAGGGTAYAWSPPDGLSCTNCTAPIAQPTATTRYTVTISTDDGCTAERQVVVSVHPLLQTTIANDTSICRGHSARLRASGGTSYRWSPPDGLSCTDCAQPVASPEHSILYYVDISDGICTRRDSVRIDVVVCELHAAFAGVGFPALPTCHSDTGICVFTNTGEEPIQLASWNITGPDISEFTVLAPDFTPGLLLGPQESLQFTVIFHPQSEGLLSAGITVRTASPDSLLTAELTGESIKSKASVVFGEGNTIVYGLETQLDLKAGSNQWDEADIRALAVEIAFRKEWMRYGGHITRGPALDSSWTFDVQEHPGALPDEHVIIINVSGSTPIAVDGTIATVHLQLLLSKEHVYTPVVRARAVEREACVDIDGRAGTIDMRLCLQNLRPITHSGTPYKFDMPGGTLVSRNAAEVLYSAALKADTRMEVYNQFGQLVAVYDRSTLPVGEYREELNLQHLAPGLYIIRYTSGPYTKAIPFLVGAE